MATLNIPVTKAGRSIEADPNALPDAMYRMVIEEGLKVLLNKGMSKIITKNLKGDDLAKAQDAAYEQGLKNLENLKTGNVKKGRSASTNAKVPGIVLTEARRLAKEVVKNEIKAAGIRISHIPASDITKAANALIEADPSYIQQAQANIEARAQIKSAVDVTSLVHIDPKLVKADEDRKAAAKKQLSAKQAGKAAPRKGAQPNA